jgi:hypothetical protein
MTQITKTLSSLADLSGNPAHKKRPLPKIWINALSTAFPDVEKRTEVPKQQPGRLGALIPNTTLVLRVKHFIWAFIKVIFNFWLIIEIHKKDPQSPASAVVAISIIDAFKDMKESLVSLDENQGEMCTYVALIKSGDPIKVAMGIYPERNQLIKTHQQEVCHNCPLTACSYFSEGCQANEQDLLDITNRLVEKKVFEIHSEQTLWVTL